MELETARASSVRVTDDSITVELEDGRTVVVPTEWYPRLLHATTKERANYEITNDGVIWPEVDADFSIRGIPLGRKSGECRESFKFWLDARRSGKRATLTDFVNYRRKMRKAGRPRDSRRAAQR